MQDAKDVEKILKQQYGFDTKLLLNAKRDEIVDELNAYRSSLKENDSFLIYYAQDTEILTKQQIRHSGFLLTPKKTVIHSGLLLIQ